MKKRNNFQFIDSAILNNSTYLDYLNRLKKIALSRFEWVNLPSSMNSRFLEQSLFYFGKASLLYDKNYGYLNTKCCSNGKLNIYGLPSSLNCFSYDYNTNRLLYTGLEASNKEECILVMNDWEMTPTCGTLELFAYRLYQADRTCDVNISSQRTPILIVVDEKQRLTLENLYNQYNGNKPFIFGDKDSLSENILKAIKTDAPFITDKVMMYKKEIWLEALTFLGVNNVLIEKKERLITDEANSNNDVINLNLQAYLAPRQQACKQFNELFGFKNTDNEISVKVRKDILNDVTVNEVI